MHDHLIIIGAQRSATTYLYRMLDQHPDITMARPVRPEPKHFIRDAFEPDAEAYRRALFADASTRWLGEKSTSYIEYPVAATRIVATLPDAHIICMLRDPVERAISNYRFSVANGLETLSLDDALAAEADRVAHADTAGVSVSPYAYTGRGHYADYLDAWRAVFPAERIHLLTTERTVGDEGALRALFSRLGLDEDVGLEGVGEAVNDSPKDGDDVPDELRQRLRRLFSEWNHELGRRHGVDTSAWQ